MNPTLLVLIGLTGFNRQGGMRIPRKKRMTLKETGAAPSHNNAAPLREDGLRIGGGDFVGCGGVIERLQLLRDRIGLVLDVVQEGLIGRADRSRIVLELVDFSFELGHIGGEPIDAGADVGKLLIDGCGKVTDG
jgi:hypothetical protein